MGRSLTEKLIEEHLVEGGAEPGEEIALRIDQTLTQDATGTLVMLELEAMGLVSVRAELSAQYVDHNLLGVDHKNADDQAFLHSACRRFGIWYCPPGEGVSHPVHQQRFGAPGKTLLGSDSHTPAAGGIGMLAMGTGGLDVALAIAGEPYRVRRPRVIGVRLDGELPDAVSAKDVVLELLRRRGVRGARGAVLEYHGPGLAELDAMDRHVIANMGTELGATSSVFPADDEVRRFLRSCGREDAWVELAADEDVAWDEEERVDLSSLVPLIAMPSSPGNVVRVEEVEGRPIAQAYIGSSANPGYGDFAVAAEIVHAEGKHPAVSLDVNPTSRAILEALLEDGVIATLVRAGARIHQAGCNGCIGMGQAPATGTTSLRTVPRNFPGRSGTREDAVCLVSPETAAASAARGEITDPRRIAAAGARRRLRRDVPRAALSTVVAPLPDGERETVQLRKGPNIAELPELDPLSDFLELVVATRVGDDISTDEILPAGGRALPLRSNIPRISEFAFEAVDSEYTQRAKRSRESGGHAIVAGQNYGQGSSREHAALAPRFLGLRLVLAESYARIHWQNLVNFGVLPLVVERASDLSDLEPGDRLRVEDVRERVRRGSTVEVLDVARGRVIVARHELSERQVDVLLGGGIIAWMRDRVRA